MVDSVAMSDESKLPELLTLTETAKILRVHPNTLRNWDEKGILKAVRLGKRRDRRYKKEDVLKLMEKSG